MKLEIGGRAAAAVIHLSFGTTAGELMLAYCARLSQLDVPGVICRAGSAHEFARYRAATDHHMPPLWMAIESLTCLDVKDNDQRGERRVRLSI